MRTNAKVHIGIHTKTNDVPLDITKDIKKKAIKDNKRYPKINISLLKLKIYFKSIT